MNRFALRSNVVIRALALLSLAGFAAAPLAAADETSAEPDIEASFPLADDSASSERPDTESTKAFQEFVATLSEVQEIYLSPKRRVSTAQDVADGNRFLMHLLAQSLALDLEAKASHPVMERLVRPNRKLGGDNADAIYFGTPIDSRHAYKITSNQVGAVYTSITIEVGGGDSGYAGGIGAVINDTDYEVQEDGSFELYIGGPERDRDWVAMPEHATRISTRHYFEEAKSASSDLKRHVPMHIEVLDPGPPPPTPDDASIAAQIRAVTKHFRSRSLDQPMPDPMPTWVSFTPNKFSQPLKPGSMAYAAADAAYTQAPYAIAPDEALVITGRWPKCRIGNVTVWNRYLQSYDYLNRQISLNRKQTVLEPDGSFKIVLAHSDPGLPNWIDTEGRTGGMIFWRFMMPEGEIETPVATVVKFAELAK